MKVFEWLFYFIIFNAVLYLFFQIGLISTASNVGVPESDWAITSIQSFFSFTGIAGFASIGFGLLSSVISIAGGVNPYLSFAYGVMTGVFVNMWMKVFAVMDNISTHMGEHNNVMGAFKIIFITIFGILLLYTYIQMATGGGRGYE